MKAEFPAWVVKGRSVSQTQGSFNFLQMPRDQLAALETAKQDQRCWHQAPGGWGSFSAPPTLLSSLGQKISLWQRNHQAKNRLDSAAAVASNSSTSFSVCHLRRVPPCDPDLPARPASVRNQCIFQKIARKSKFCLNAVVYPIGFPLFLTG